MAVEALKLELLSVEGSRYRLGHPHPAVTREATGEVPRWKTGPPSWCRVATMDKLYSALNIANGALAMGMDVCPCSLPSGGCNA
jgi:hypothetical protein